MYFANKKGYEPVHPDGDYQGENTIKVGVDWYWGWVGSNAYKSSLGWDQTLLDAYNAGLGYFDTISIQDVPGYTRQAGFFNIPQVEWDVFKLRTGGSSTP